jgi:hypothetical protein
MGTERLDSRVTRAQTKNADDRLGRVAEHLENPHPAIDEGGGHPITRPDPAAANPLERVTREREPAILFADHPLDPISGCSDVVATGRIAGDLATLFQAPQELAEPGRVAELLL